MDKKIFSGIPQSLERGIKNKFNKFEVLYIRDKENRPIGSLGLATLKRNPDTIVVTSRKIHHTDRFCKKTARTLHFRDALTEKGIFLNTPQAYTHEIDSLIDEYSDRYIQNNFSCKGLGSQHKKELTNQVSAFVRSFQKSKEWL